MLNNLRYTASSHTIAFPAQIIFGSGILPGDEIGVFTGGGICAGRITISDLQTNVAITAYADDEITPTIEGFETGEMLQFKVYRPGTNQGFDLDVEFDPALPNLGVFAMHGLSAAKSLKM